MIKEFVNKWEKNKDNLEKYFRRTPQTEYDSYEKIVILLFKYVINKDEYGKYITTDIKIIDDGDYSGSQIFILHKDTYCPGIEDYVYTTNYYGSCSGCDTLYGISDYDTDELPTEHQIEGYMLLALHLLQKCNYFVEDKEK